MPACTHRGIFGPCPLFCEEGCLTCALHHFNDPSPAELAADLLAGKPALRLDSIQIHSGDFRGNLRNFTFADARMSEIRFEQSIWQNFQLQEVLIENSLFSSGAWDQFLIENSHLTNLGFAGFAFVEARIQFTDLSQITIEQSRLHRSAWASLQGGRVHFRNSLIEECSFLDLDIEEIVFENCRILASELESAQKPQLRNCLIQKSPGFESGA